METFAVGEQVWAVLLENLEDAGPLDQGGSPQTSGPATSVIVAPATVLEGGLVAQLTNGGTVELIPGRTFHDREDAEQAAEALATDTDLP